MDMKRLVFSEAVYSAAALTAAAAAGQRDEDRLAPARDM